MYHSAARLSFVDTNECQLRLALKTLRPFFCTQRPTSIHKAPKQLTQKSTTYKTQNSLHKAREQSIRSPSASRRDSWSTTPVCGHRRPRHCMDVPPTRLSTVGNQAFPVTAARTWNSLPAEVTSSNSLQTFKTKLKSHLFSASFP